ncbi:hypothetical protein PUN28_017138 [Cardiocondyla obscurior]|uniref:Uncharacterized protein n=1 Tax=Cardiocondyla obscurior TaxID=286306 RepID=A0AAW2EPE7_9HYME
MNSFTAFIKFIYSDYFKYINVTGGEIDRFRFNGIGVFCSQTPHQSSSAANLRTRLPLLCAPKETPPVNGIAAPKLWQRRDAFVRATKNRLPHNYESFAVRMPLRWDGCLRFVASAFFL